MPLARYDTALAREVAATGWYLGLPAVQVGRPCAVCDAGPLVRADNATLLRELHADAKRRGKARKPPRQAYPYALEGRYRAQLLRRVRSTHQLLLEAMRQEIAPLREGINARARERDRADAMDLVQLSGGLVDDLELAALLVDCRLDGTAAQDRRRLLRVIDRVQAAVAQAAAPPVEAVHELAALVRDFATRSVTNQLLTVVAIDVLPTLGQASHLLGKWATDQVALIKSLDARYFDEIREAVVTTITEGQSTRTLSQAIQERYGVARSRADLIATDQVGTLNGKITEERQTKLGIEEYTWSNSGDVRVRPLHRNPGDSGAAAGALGGTVRRWSEPHPTEGHPGYPIRCRCSAIPVI